MSSYRYGTEGGESTTNEENKNEQKQQNMNLVYIEKPFRNLQRLIGLCLQKKYQNADSIPKMYTTYSSGKQGEEADRAGDHADGRNGADDPC